MVLSKFSIAQDVRSHQDLEEVAQEGQRCPEEVRRFTRSLVKCWGYGMVIPDLVFFSYSESNNKKEGKKFVIVVINFLKF
jgi:hypothetical protein